MSDHPLKAGLAEAMGYIKANEALLARAEAAEARCERLADILREAIEWDGHDSEGIPAVWTHKAATELQKMDAALSDTAQRKVCKHCGEVCGRVHPGLALCFHGNAALPLDQT